MSKLTQKALTFLIRKDAGSSTKVEVYPAELWTGRPGAERGRYRVRVDRVWDSASGHWTFRDYDGVLDLLRELSLSVLDGTPPARQSRPALPRGSRVRVPCGRDAAGNTLYMRTMTTTPPFMAIDGHWYSFVVGGNFADANGEMKPVRIDAMKIL
jgi:hypothetical protein